MIVRRAEGSPVLSECLLKMSMLIYLAPQEYDELTEMQVKLEERLQELEANPPRCETHTHTHIWVLCASTIAPAYPQHALVVAAAAVATVFPPI